MRLPSRRPSLTPSRRSSATASSTTSCRARRPGSPRRSRIAWRFLTQKPDTTVPRAPIPVQRLTRGGAGRGARCQPVPAGALHLAAEAGRRALAHRPGVLRARVAGAVDGPEALSCAADRHRRSAADQGRDPVARPLRPPRPCRHHEAGAQGGGVHHAARRGRPPDRLGRGPRPRCASSTGGRRPRCTAFGWWPCRPSISPAAGSPTATAPCGRRGSSWPATCACSSAATPAITPTSRPSASASVRST